MNIPKELYYTKEHEWIAVSDGIATVGITEYAQGELGDVVFVELPNVGKKINQMEAFGTIEAVKAVSDLFAPVTGEVIEVNGVLADTPETVNRDPYGEGWMIKVKMSNPSEVNSLLTSDAYQKLVG